MFTRVSLRALTVPSSLRRDDPRNSFPSSPFAVMLHVAMGSITVRVTPRSGRTEVEEGPDGVIVRVRAAPEGGKATDEAAAALAATLGVSRTRVRLRSGARSRTKTFEIEGLSAPEIARRLHGG
jgi:uncharacterized protein YggU (UPF0235/DUF167 family)